MNITFQAEPAQQGGMNIKIQGEPAQKVGMDITIQGELVQQGGMNIKNSRGASSTGGHEHSNTKGASSTGVMNINKTQREPAQLVAWTSYLKGNQLNVRKKLKVLADQVGMNIITQGKHAQKAGMNSTI